MRQQFGIRIQGLMCFLASFLFLSFASAQTDSEEIVAEDFGSGGIEINYWNGFAGPDGAIMVEMVRAFAEANPDVKVKMQIMPWPVYFDKLAAAIVAGSGGPDLMVLWHSVVPQYALPGLLQPVAQEMFDNGMLDPQDFPPQALSAVTFDDTAYTVPFDNYGVGVYVNADLLEKAGLDPTIPPTNQEEFLEYARKLTWDVNGKHPGEEGFDPTKVDVWGYHVGWSRATIQPALYQWGADILSRDTQPQVLINSEGAVAATQFFVDLIHKHNVAPPSEGFDANTAFANGKLAMLPDGSWLYNFVNQQDVNAVLWPYPQFGPERGATIMWSHTFAVPQTVEGEKLEATKRLIKYLSDNSRTWTAKAGMPTARLSLRDDSLKAEVWTLDTFDKQFQSEGVTEFASDRFTEIMDAVSAAWTSALTEQTSVQDALNDAASRLERILR
jgi:multiple sugar transport system substrate-binding protein